MYANRVDKFLSSTIHILYYLNLKHPIGYSIKSKKCMQIEWINLLVLQIHILYYLNYKHPIGYSIKSKKYVNREDKVLSSEGQ